MISSADAANDISSSPTVQDEPLGCLKLLLAYHQIASDIGQLRHELGDSGAIAADDLARLAKRHGARARVVRADFATLAALPLPAILETSSGYVIVGKVEGGKALVQRYNAGALEQWDAGVFEAQGAQRLVLITTRESVAGKERRFDVSWFIPALVRYRGHLGEVFLASLFIQLLGLLSPIFFQIVIDKVLVHRSLTTLEVLALGLTAIFVFETLLSGVAASKDTSQPGRRR